MTIKEISNNNFPKVYNGLETLFTEQISKHQLITEVQSAILKKTGGIRKKYSYNGFNSALAEYVFSWISDKTQKTNILYNMAEDMIQNVIEQKNLGTHLYNKFGDLYIIEYESEENIIELKKMFDNFSEEFFKKML